VVDHHSHVQEPVTWLSEVDPALARRVPGSALLCGTAGFVGVGALDPPDVPFWVELARWSEGRLLADARRLAQERATAAFFSVDDFDPGQRLEGLDRVGVAHQVCNPTVAVHVVVGLLATEPTLVSNVVAAYNE
jgi:hypothetical protein